MALQGRVVQAHAGDRAPERLHAHRRPYADFLPLLVGVVVPPGPARPLAPGLHPCTERAELVVVPRLQPIDERYRLADVDLAPAQPQVRLAVRARAVIVEQLLFRHDNGLAVVRDHHCDPRNVRRPIRPGHGQAEAPRDGEEAPLQVCVAQRCLPTTIVLEERLDGSAALEEVRTLGQLLLGGNRVVGQREGLPTQATVLGTLGEGQLPHGVALALVLVAEIRHDAVPDVGEHRGHVAGPRLRSILEDDPREALRDLCDRVRHAERAQPAASLDEDDADAQEHAAHLKPHGRVRAEHVEGHGPEKRPLVEVRPPV
mmetsp:Transcript_116952/g.338007  ORF Transcript_116952/g.338007 Transcript_116952/m.338007 type:complete len:315 (-) Transcript_116952:830-1774(-)